MKQLLLMLTGAILLSSCASFKAKPVVSVDTELYHSRSWRTAVLDLDYEYEDEGTMGATNYVSAGKDGGAVIAGLLANELAGLENIKIIERRKIEAILAEQEIQLSGAIDGDSAVEIGRLTGADGVGVGELVDYVYWQSLGVSGTTVSFSMRMIDIETGEVLFNASISRARSLTDIFPNSQVTVNELVDAIR